MSKKFVFVITTVMLILIILSGHPFGLAADAQTIEPFRGGISCASQEWREYVKLEPFRCGLEGGGPSRYKHLVGLDCRERNSNNQVTRTMTFHVFPRTDQWIGCGNAL